jgi:prepilin peptidase CpaA
MNAAAVQLSLTLLFVALAAVWDLRMGHIPNRLTLLGLLAGGLLHVATLCWFTRPAGEPFRAALLGTALAQVALGVLACGLVPYLLFLRQGMGGGDVKLLAAVGAFLGPVAGLEVELYSFLAMALFAPARLAYDGRLLRTLGNSAALLANPFLPKDRRRTLSPELLSSLKFGPAVFVGMVALILIRWGSA